MNSVDLVLIKNKFAIASFDATPWPHCGWQIATPPISPIPILFMSKCERADKSMLLMETPDEPSTFIAFGFSFDEHARLGPHGSQTWMDGLRITFYDDLLKVLPNIYIQLKCTAFNRMDVNTHMNKAHFAQITERVNWINSRDSKKYILIDLRSINAWKRFDCISCVTHVLHSLFRVRYELRLRKIQMMKSKTPS